MVWLIKNGGYGNFAEQGFRIGTLVPCNKADTAAATSGLAYPLALVVIN